MRSPRERSRDRARKRAWGAACASVVALATIATAFSCATQESHDFSDNPCVAGGCEQLTAAGSGVTTSSSSTSSSGGCIDAGCPSWATDIYGPMIDSPLTKCTTAGLCHGGDAGGGGGLQIFPNDPVGTYMTLTASTLKTAPIPNASAAKQYVVTCDPGNSGMLCNMAVSSGTNKYGQCGHEMPLSGATDLDSTDLDKIAKWIQCGAPNN